MSRSELNKQSNRSIPHAVETFNRYRKHSTSNRTSPQAEGIFFKKVLTCRISETKMGEVEHKKGQISPKLAQVGFKLASVGPKLAQTGAKSGNGGAKLAQVGAKLTQVGPSWR